MASGVPSQRRLRVVGWTMLALSGPLLWWACAQPARVAQRAGDSEWVDARTIEFTPPGDYWLTAMNRERELGLTAAAALASAGGFVLLLSSRFWPRRGAPDAPERRSRRLVLPAWCFAICLMSGFTAVILENLDAPEWPKGPSPPAGPRTLGSALVFALLASPLLYVLARSYIPPLLLGRDVMRGPRLRREAEARRVARETRRQARLAATR